MVRFAICWAPVWNELDVMHDLLYSLQVSSEWAGMKISSTSTCELSLRFAWPTRAVVAGSPGMTRSTSSAIRSIRISLGRESCSRRRSDVSGIGVLIRFETYCDQTYCISAVITRSRERTKKSGDITGSTSKFESVLIKHLLYCNNMIRPRRENICGIDCFSS